MKQIFIPVEDFLKLTKMVSKIESKIIELNKKIDPTLSEKWLTISQVCKILAISTRTCQKYRDTNVLPYSQFKNKIYIKASDVEAHLVKHYTKIAK